MPIFHRQSPSQSSLNTIRCFFLKLSVSLSTNNNNNNDKRRKFIINLSSCVLFLSNHSQNKNRKRPKRVDILYDFLFWDQAIKSRWKTKTRLKTTEKHTFKWIWFQFEWKWKWHFDKISIGVTSKWIAVKKIEHTH